jgi:hypothetical protein
MIIVTTIYKKTFVILALSILLLSTNTLGQDIEIYVSDAGNFASPPWKILKFDENGENPTIFIDTLLAWPQDIVFLEDQQVVLISNLNSGKITKYNSTTGSYIADFATGIGGPTRMKIGADSLLYVLQWNGNGKVKRYQLDGTFIDDFTSVGVPQSIGVDWDSNGNLYVSSYTGHTVRKFDQNGNDLGLFINSNLLGPTNIWFDDNGDLLVSDYNGTAVKRFDSDGNYLSDFITGIHFSEGVGFYPNGNILIGNGSTSSVKLFDSSGNYIKDLIPSGSGGLITPNAVVIRETNVLSVSGEEALGSKSFILEQNYPNPFNPNTKIKFTVTSNVKSEKSSVSLIVYNILGKKIATLVNKELPAGEYEVEFNAVSNYSEVQNLSSGVYFYQLKSGNFIRTNKMVYLK